MHRVAIGLAAAVVMISATACGDDDDAAPSTVIVTTTAEPETTPPRTVVVTEPTEPPTTEATTTTEAPTTTESVEFVKAEDFFEGIAANTTESLTASVALAEPTTAAWQYAQGLAVTQPWDTSNQPPADLSGGDGTWSIPRGDGTRTEFSDVVFSQNGLIADFSRNGVPVSQSVYASGQEFPFDGGLMTIIDFRLWDGNVNVLYLVRNDNAESTPFFDTYVAEGRQFGVAYELSQLPDPRPGATQVGFLVFANAPRGGVISGYSPANDYTEISLQVPA
jgi:hypothetical protein